MGTGSFAGTRPAEAGAVVVEPSILTILGTYRCTAACRNCCFDSNPGIRQRLGIEDILSFIDEGARSPACRLVVFSGGECFLLGKDLNRAVAYATERGLATRCVTNGYWAKKPARGRVRLEQLRAAGLKELNISTGDYHQQFVPEETVVNAACLGVEVGLDQTVVMVELQRTRHVTAARLARDPRIREMLTDRGSRFQILESPWMPMSHEMTIEQDEKFMLHRGNAHLRQGCNSVLTTLVLTPDRKVGLCCGLTRELIPELNEDWGTGPLQELVRTASRDFMKIWLYVDGPERILAWAAQKDGRIEWENRYAHHCHACLAVFADPLVREVIRTHYRERVDDVLTRFVVRFRSQQAARHDLAVC